MSIYVKSIRILVLAVPKSSERHASTQSNSSEKRDDTVWLLDHQHHEELLGRQKLPNPTAETLHEDLW